MSPGPFEAEIVAANAAFYRAFQEKDVEAMDRLWATRTVVCCIHPGWDVLHGREAVMASWLAILGAPEAPEIRCSDVTVVEVGDAGLVTCIEELSGGQLVATNVFVREAGAWKMVHHQAGPVAPTSRRSGDRDPSLN